MSVEGDIFDYRYFFHFQLFTKISKEGKGKVKVFKMSGESSASKIFPTFDESELKRILEEKDSKNTRRATKSAVKIFGSYLNTFRTPVRIYL
jgi:hypothetical protein